MTILVVHNRYLESGGEDRVVDVETRLLERHGHRVVRYTADNHQIATLTRAALARRTVWNHGTYRDVRKLVVREHVDLLHVHNTLPLISPSVYYAARAEGIPVVQTLHNYRMICPNAVCVRDGAVCTDCVGGALPWRAVRHACYRGSRTATAAVAGTILVHRLLKTWTCGVDLYIAPTDFSRRMFVAGGLPPDRIVTKPHFVDPDPGIGTGAGGYALYVGRLSVEKGVGTLLDAWTRLGTTIPLTLVGDGPLAPVVAEAAGRLPGIRWVGHQTQGEAQRLIRDAAFLVSPSIAYETFGQVVVEAYAAGTPVVACAGGAAAELVQHRRTGLLMRRGDADDLVTQVEWLVTHPAEAAAMRTAARAEYERRFTAEANYRILIGIYDAAARSAPLPAPAPRHSWGSL